MKVCWACGCIVLAGSLALGGGGGEGSKKLNGDFDVLFKKLDSNMDGKLSKDEFLKMAERAKQKDEARQKLSQAYDKLDPEKKGVTKEIFRRFLAKGKNGGPAPEKSK